MKRRSLRNAAWLSVGLLGLGQGLFAQERREPDRTRAFYWKGVVERGYLGLEVVGMTPELRRHFGAPEDAGVLVARVRQGSPAEGAGILVGDIVAAVDAEPVDSPMRLSHAVGDKSAGDAVAVEIWRDGSARTLTVTVAERDRHVMDLATMPDFVFAPGDKFFIAGAGPHLDEDAMAALEEARKQLVERFESEEWQQKLDRLRELDVSKVEERIRVLEKRLQELERELGEPRDEK
jgi:membrane-associated protease RseP (regulator of RpoE activity)